MRLRPMRLRPPVRLYIDAVYTEGMRRTGSDSIDLLEDYVMCGWIRRARFQWLRGRMPSRRVKHW